ncbi:MAG: hypothetical protein ACYTGV_06180 [Planctomycetota bacterium]|jgi:hypothetical protein
MNSMRLALRCCGWLVVLTALAVVGTGCSSSENGNARPTLSFQAPAADSDLEIGGLVTISYTDNDAEDPATTDLVADLDGNPATAGDQIVLAASRPHQAGAQQNLDWNTAGVAAGTWTIIATTDDGVNSPVVTICPAKVVLHTLWPLDHTNIVLRDYAGDAIPAGSTDAYSPRQTCGHCHDVDNISNAYHFQQGRTDASGQIIMADDYFGDNRPWLKSPGMYGKW